MSIVRYNRRNFLSSLAILSAGSAFSSPVKLFSPANNNATRDLKKRWIVFCKKSGARVLYSSSDINTLNNKNETKGHYYEYGEMIYFPNENILARPAWIFWNDCKTPADVVVTLFENNHSFKKIIALNRYELDALYRLSKEPEPPQLLLTSFNKNNLVPGAPAGTGKIKTRIKKNSPVQEISYYKGQPLVLHKKFIYNT